LRPRALGIDCKSMHTIQPAAYYRYMNLPHKLGIHPDYMCFTVSGMMFMNKMFQGYSEYKHIGCSDINMSMNTGISQLLSSGVKSMMLENDKIAKMIRLAKNQKDPALKLNNIIMVQEKSTEMLSKLLTLLHTDAFVTAVVMNYVVPSAVTSTAATQDNTPVQPLSYSAPIVATREALVS
jgi:hypothetical protein